MSPIVIFVDIPIYIRVYILSAKWFRKVKFSGSLYKKPDFRKLRTVDFRLRKLVTGNECEELVILSVKCDSDCEESRPPQAVKVGA